MSRPGSPQTAPVQAAQTQAAQRQGGSPALAAIAGASAGGMLWLGFIGSVLITVGSLGSAAVTHEDDVLERAHLAWLRYGHGETLSTWMLRAGLLLLILAWIRIGRATLVGNTTRPQLQRAAIVWVAPLIAAVPLFSRDAYSYVAQGAMLRDGFDPYVHGPAMNPNPILDDVSGDWTTTATPYGPFFLLVAKTVTQITGDSVVAGIIGMRLVFLPGLALMLWAVPRIAEHFSMSSPMAIWLVPLNPLVLVMLIGGVHNEALMCGLMAAAVALILRRHHLPAVALLGTAVAIKATAGFALPFFVWIWMAHLREDIAAGKRRRDTELVLFLKTAITSVGLFAAVFAAFSLLAGVGLGWLGALQGSAKIINWLSPATATAQMIDIVISPLVDISLAPILTTTRAVAVIAMVLGLVIIWWRFRRSEAAAMTGILLALTWSMVCYPALLPWYGTWPLTVIVIRTWTPRQLSLIVGASVWLTIVTRSDGYLPLYEWDWVAVCAVLAVLAGYLLMHPDPLLFRRWGLVRATPSAPTRTARIS